MSINSISSKRISSQARPFIVLALLSLIFFSSLFLYQCAQNEDARFTAYTDLLFRQEVSDNAITLHYTLKDPAAHRISNTPTNLGRVTTDTDSIGAAAENALTTLHKYSKNKLSTENQLTYELLENAFTLSKNMAKYALYEEPLSPLTGTQAQLPILLSEYQFYSVADINTYLTLLKNLPEYFQGIMDFETAKSEQGLFMTQARAEAVIEECNAFVNMGTSNYLHDTFKNRLTSLNLSDKEYQYYIEENASIIETYVYPAYISLRDYIEKLKTSGINENGLCHFPDGKEYYELLVNNVTGSSRTILELQTLTLQQINDDLKSMQNVLDTLTTANTLTANTLTADTITADTPTADTVATNTANILQDSNPSSILITLKDKLSGCFPDPPEVNISVKYVEESMEDYLSPAFYLTPAIDNLEENVIYINPQHMNDDISLFTTLAHEGYPGHLYQTTYFANTNPSPIRHLLSCGGYVEGWATYCEMMSYYFLPELQAATDTTTHQTLQQSKSEAAILQKNSSVMLGLYALADMGIHYEGWTLIDTIDFFRNYGIYDTAAISEIFNMILGDPANYLKYYIGYIEFLELKKDAISEWGNEFTQERFHQEILETGPVPFDLLRKKMGLN